MSSGRARGAPRAGLAIALWLLALTTGVLLIAGSRFSADLSAFLPSSPDPRQQVLIEQLRSGIAARTLLIAIDGGDAAQRADASRELAAAMRAGAHFGQVRNGDFGADAGGEAALGRWLFEHRYRLSPAVSPERFTPEGLREGLGETLSLLGTPAGAVVKATLERDPTGETQRIVEGLIPANAPRTEQGVWAAREAPRALLLATLRTSVDDLDAQAAALDAVRAAFARSAAAGLQLQLSGAPLFAVDSRTRIEREVGQLAIGGAVVIGALLLFAFGSLRALGVALLPVATGIVGGIAAVGTVFGDVHGITLAFGSTLIGESVDYAIYYLIQARSAGAGGAAGWQRWRELNWPTVRLGLLTSVCGFAALLFSGFPGLAQLGLFSIAGLTSAALTTRYLLPALVPDGASGQGLRRHLARLASFGVATLPRLRMLWLVLGLVSLALLAHGWGQLWRGSLASLSPVPQAAQALDASLRADLGASDAGTLVVASGADIEAALRAAEAAMPRLEELVASGVIAGYESPARLLPSIARQRERLAALPPPEVLRERLGIATAGGPLPAQRLEPFIAAADAARHAPPLDHASVRASPAAPLVDALLFERAAGGWTALLPLHPAADEPIAAPVRAALHGLDGAHAVQVIDIGRELDRLYAHYLNEALVQALLGGLGVVALLAWHLRSPRRLARVCLPLVLAVVLTLGGLALLDVALGILHLVGLLLVVAVGSNYGLFFDQLHSDGRADPDTLASLLLANLTTVASFGLIALSDIPALSAIGRVVAPGALLALLLAAAMARMERRAAPAQP